jgi:hypothetical protein
VIVDLFRRPGGWSEGLRLLGLTDIGLEWDTAACRTAHAAGHLVIQTDVSAVPDRPVRRPDHRQDRLPALPGLVARRKAWRP